MLVEGEGRFYWCAKVTRDLSDSGEIYMRADEIAIIDGAAVFLRGSEPLQHQNLVIAAGKWMAIFAASLVAKDAVTDSSKPNPRTGPTS